MKLLIEKNIKDKFPELNLVLLPVYNVGVKPDNTILTEENLADKLKSLLTKDFFNQEMFKAFRGFYQNLGLNPVKEPPSVENLYRRYQETKRLPQANNIVNICNLMAMKTLVPLGVFDIGKIKDSLMLRFSKEGEEFRPLSGGMEFLPAGIAVIADEEKILNKFPYQDSIYPKITKQTKNILILGDIVKGVETRKTEDAVNKTGLLIQKMAGGKLGKVFYPAAQTNEKVLTTSKVKKKSYTILTGITPSGSGEVHIGNYFGMVEPFFNMAEKADKVYYFIADLHALTTVQNKQELKKNVENIVLSYLAFGFDPKKIYFYRQSDIPLHTELQSILNNVTPLSLIKRCHAYKDKLGEGADPEQINMGLFNYPILQAADILLYDPDYIPVGEDQRQHIEITRDIGQYFNKAFGQTFKLPQIYNVKKTARIIGTDGKRKMSKSLGNDISVFEDEKVIKKQIMGCFTDPKRIHSTDPGRVENNPIFIYHDLINENKSQVEDLKQRYQTGKVGDVEIKEKLFQAHLKRFAKQRQRYQQLKNNPEKIKQILKTGAEKVRSQAEKKMIQVRQAIGLTNKYSFFKY